MKGPKPVIGVAGGIASGKSLVAKLLGEHFGGVISSDEMNHAVLATEDVRRTIQSWWGPETYDSQGYCNRKRLAEIVFDDPEARRRLEALTHPRIDRLREAAMRRLEADPNVKGIVIDSPLLFEAGLDRLCDKIVFVEADKSIRVQRARQSRGWDEAELDRREKHQNALDSKRRRADYIVENNSDISDLRRKVDSLFHQMTDL